MNKVRILRHVLVKGKSIDHARTQRERQVPCRAWRCHTAFVMPSQIMYNWPSDSSACKGPSFGFLHRVAFSFVAVLANGPFFTGYRKWLRARSYDVDGTHEPTINSRTINSRTPRRPRPTSERIQLETFLSSGGPPQLLQTSWPMGIGAFSLDQDVHQGFPRCFPGGCDPPYLLAQLLAPDALRCKILQLRRVIRPVAPPAFFSQESLLKDTARAVSKVPTHPTSILAESCETSKEAWPATSVQRMNSTRSTEKDAVWPWSAFEQAIREPSMTV